MNESKILTSIEECKQYFKSIKIDIEYSNKIKKLTIDKFSSQYNEQLVYNKSDYITLYSIAMTNQDYDFYIPKDNSFFQFYLEKRNNKVSSIHYVFYSNPKNLEQINEIVNSEKTKNEFSYSDFCDIFDLVDERRNYLYFRYDYDQTLYKELVHPVSHLHIGFDNEIRVPLDKILTPEEFINFIMKFSYKEEWQKAYDTNSSFSKHIKELKSQCEKIESDLFSDEEKKCLYLY